MSYGGLPRPYVVRVPQQKAAPKEVVDAILAALETYVKDEHGGNRGAAAEALGFTPTTVSDVLNRRKGPGINLVIALREKTGRSVDDIMGLGPPRPPDALTHEDASVLQGKMDELMAMLRARPTGRATREYRALVTKAEHIRAQKWRNEQATKATPAPRAERKAR